MKRSFRLFLTSTACLLESPDVPSYARLCCSQMEQRELPGQEGAHQGRWAQELRWDLLPLVVAIKWAQRLLWLLRKQKEERKQSWSLYAYSDSNKRSLKWRYSCSSSQFAKRWYYPKCSKVTTFDKNSSRLCACWKLVRMVFPTTAWGSLCSSVWRLCCIDGQLEQDIISSISQKVENVSKWGLWWLWIQKGHLCEPFISGPGRLLTASQKGWKTFSGVGLPRQIIGEPL